MINTKVFKNGLRERRTAVGLKQLELATKSGVGIATISRLEIHHLPVSTKTAVALAPIGRQGSILLDAKADIRYEQWLLLGCRSRPLEDETGLCEANIHT